MKQMGFAIIQGVYLLLLLYALPTLYLKIKHAKKSWWRIAIAIIVGYLAIDLISGVVHVYFDNSKIQEDGNFLFNALRNDFQKHHSGGGIDLLDTPTLEVLAHPTLLWSIPITIFSVIFVSNPVIQAGLMSMAIFGGLSHKMHQYAHRRMAGRPIPYLMGKLQDFGLFIHPATHAMHHSDTRYNHSIFHGWANPILNIIRDYMFPLEKI